MAIPKNKEELIKAIVEHYSMLAVELSDICPEIAEKKELAGHAKNTSMSIKDLISYLNGWGQLVIKWYNKKNKGLDVDFPETGYKWNELGLLAQKFYKDYESESFVNMIICLDKTTSEILKIVEGKTNGELYETAWYDKWTLGKMIQLNTSSPFKNARDRIRKWKKLNQQNLSLKIDVSI